MTVAIGLDLVMLDTKYGTAGKDTGYAGLLSKLKLAVSSTYEDCGTFWIVSEKGCTIKHLVSICKYLYICFPDNEKYDNDIGAAITMYRGDDDVTEQVKDMVG